MVIFGLILLAIGALGILLGIFKAGEEATTSDGKTDVHTTFLGIEMSASTLFIVAVVATSLVFVGLWFLKYGAKQGWKARKEQKRLEELSEKLDKAERRRGDEGEETDNA
ncbi:hypothetical protein [Nocardioides stalactiti]|uniref:hypothetical protein n=1 Tax=Nocardioides stalactiti TaxID=2755356 RepID=UPI0016020222|nr:hypothetical protein [Nocardioides stalactiti]